MYETCLILFWFLIKYFEGEVYVFVKESNKKISSLFLLYANIFTSSIFFRNFVGIEIVSSLSKNLISVFLFLRNLFFKFIF